MTPQTTTTTIQTCPAGCPGVWNGFAFCPTCGGPLRTVTVTLEPVPSAPHIQKVVLFDGGQMPSLDGGDGCQKGTK